MISIGRNKEYQDVQVLPNSSRPAIHTLNELKPFTLPPFSEETLHPGGYYYELAARTLGLENLKIYMFSCSPDRYFLYISKADCLNEVPSGLILLSSNDFVPEDILSPGGILYRIIDSHTNLAHMSFYSFPMLPGRLFVYDGGLNRLIETRMSSRFAISLLGEVESSPKVPSQAATEGHKMPSKLSCREQDPTVHCSTAGTLNFKFETTEGLYHYTSPTVESHTSSPLATVRRTICNGTMTVCDSPNAASRSAVASCGQHNKFSVADVVVYEPSSLTIPLPRTTSESQCLAPPCVYSGRNDDPR